MSPLGARKPRTPSSRAPVDVGPVVLPSVEAGERGLAPGLARGEELVEEALPGLHVQGCRPGHDAVEVEEERVETAELLRQRHQPAVQERALVARRCALAESVGARATVTSPRPPASRALATRRWQMSAAGSSPGRASLRSAGGPHR